MDPFSTTVQILRILLCYTTTQNVKIQKNRAVNSLRS
ncbi:unnamed protein product [Tenebrio molitor]|nr:unnamed protein product [Tenebrio molitor]